MDWPDGPEKTDANKGYSKMRGGRIRGIEDFLSECTPGGVWGIQLWGEKLCNMYQLEDEKKDQ